MNGNINHIISPYTIFTNLVEGNLGLFVEGLPERRLVVIVRVHDHLLVTEEHDLVQI